MSRNFVMLEGKLTKFSMSKTKTGKVVVHATVAFKNGFQDDGPGYVSVQCWNTTAPQRKQLKAAAGDGRVVVYGNLQQSKWETENGDKRSAMKINATSIAVAFDLPEEDKSNNNQGKKKFQDKKVKKAPIKKKRPPVEEEDEEEDDVEDEEDEEDVDDEDLPF